MSIQNKLYKKLKAEYDQFIDALKSKPTNEVIFKSYEKVFKEEFVILFENIKINNEKANVLLKLDHPLDALYQEWLDNDSSFIDMLRDCIDDTVDKVKKAEAHIPSKQAGQQKKPSIEKELKDAKNEVKARDEQNNIQIKPHQKEEI